MRGEAYLRGLKFLRPSVLSGRTVYFVKSVWSDHGDQASHRFFRHFYPASCILRPYPCFGQLLLPNVKPLHAYKILKGFCKVCKLFISAPWSDAVHLPSQNKKFIKVKDNIGQETRGLFKHRPWWRMRDEQEDKEIEEMESFHFIHLFVDVEFLLWVLLVIPSVIWQTFHLCSVYKPRVDFFFFLFKCCFDGWTHGRAVEPVAILCLANNPPPPGDEWQRWTWTWTMFWNNEKARQVTWRGFSVTLKMGRSPVEPVW